MATLEKIRSKSVLLVSIIFVALFLFIITIIDNPLSLFIDQTTVANVKGEKIDYEKYTERANLVREQNPQAPNADQQALSSLVTEALYKQEFKKLGLAVTPAEISALMVGNNAPYQVMAQFYQQFGAAPADVLNAINDPDAAGLTAEQVSQLTKGYADFEQNLEDQLLTQKLLKLMQGTINANKLDARAIFDRGNTTYTLASVSKNIYQTTDSVTPAEVEKYYKEHREGYKLTGDGKARYVRYVTLPIAPSAADRQKAVETVQTALARIQESGDMNSLLGNGAFIVEHQTADSAAVAGVKVNGLKNFLENAEAGTAEILNVNGAYIPTNPELVIARIVSRENKVNKAKIAQVVYDGTVNADTIIARLNAGVAADSIEGIAQVVPATDFTYEQLTNVIDTLQTIGAGKYLNLGQAAIAVESWGKAEPMVEYYTATYAVEPSRETIDQLNTRMRDFLISAPTAAAFNNENAMAQGLMVQETLIDASNFDLDQLDDSREMVAWAMEDAKKGEVSRLYTDSKNTRLAAIALVDEYKDYLPYTYPGLNNMLTQGAQSEKNANLIINDVKGKGSTLADYQKLLEAQRIDTLRGVNLSSNYYAMLGGLAGAKQGEVVGPVRWNSNVVVYTVVDATEGTMPYDEQSSKMQFERQAQSLVLGQNPDALLLGNGNVKYQMLRFTRR
ncbi:MAG: SurA N-terminal domain-containing protein [Bacteroides sp.]|nr:SurA N-terminal domain-containing protein [Bacteroides sp.]MCM1379044.1 SurA N-terminal domain-containing protein [Bacteroides sp.]MCM1445742.1 SurA N-terminal domain-containing protein [Prevotella sp.]